MVAFGDYNAHLTKAINRIAKQGSEGVAFDEHAQERMDERGFDHAQVMLCLRRGKAHGPEIRENELRANVVHLGIHIRVVVRGLDDVASDWGRLQAVTVVTVMGT